MWVPMYGSNRTFMELKYSRGHSTSNTSNKVLIAPLWN